MILAHLWHWVNYSAMGQLAVQFALSSFSLAFLMLKQAKELLQRHSNSHELLKSIRQPANHSKVGYHDYALSSQTLNENPSSFGTHSISTTVAPVPSPKEKSNLRSSTPDTPPSLLVPLKSSNASIRSRRSILTNGSENNSTTSLTSLAFKPAVVAPTTSSSSVVATGKHVPTDEELVARLPASVLDYDRQKDSPSPQRKSARRRQPS